MSTLNFAGVKSENGPKVIKPGIHENTLITGVVEGTTKNGKKTINIGFQTPDGATFTAECSMEGNAPQYTLSKLKHMMTKLVSEDVVDTLTTVEQVNKTLINKRLRMKFTGEEYLNKEGQVRIKTTLGLPEFAESMNVPKVDSGLIFDSSRNSDIKRLQINSSTGNPSTSPAVAPAGSDDLPF